jgi:hypothetical protein
MDNEATEADCRSTQISGPLTLGAGGFWVSLPLCRAVVFLFVSQSIFRRKKKRKIFLDLERRAAGQKCASNGRAEGRRQELGMKRKSQLNHFETE